MYFNSTAQSEIMKKTNTRNANVVALKRAVGSVI
jgi:hypothetical protein